MWSMMRQYEKVLPEITSKRFGVQTGKSRYRDMGDHRSRSARRMPKVSKTSGIKLLSKQQFLSGDEAKRFQSHCNRTHQHIRNR